MKKKMMIGSIFLLIAIILGGYYYLGKDDYDDVTVYEKVTTKKAIVENKFYVDVKGAVKDPGVYLVSDGERVIDQTTLNMIQDISSIIARKPMIIGEI